MTADLIPAPPVSDHLYGAGSEPAGEPVRIEITIRGRQSTVIVGTGLIGRAGDLTRAALPGARGALVVCDEAVAEPYGSRVAASLTAAGLSVVQTDLPRGEAAKTLHSVSTIWTACGAARLTRHDAVVAVGGGAASDTAGFAASTYSRGTPLVNVATTLLAMVDAAVGGKTGIDFAGAKNAVGSFHPAALVICDMDVLATLPAASVRHGLAEIIKTGVLASPSMLELLETAEPDGAGLPAADVLRVVAEDSIRIKAAYVTIDPEDARERHSLNLGHTFAHAVESASGYTVAHGDAVAAGLVAACRLGEREGITPAGFTSRMTALLSRWGLPIVAPPLDPVRMADAMGADKKRTAQGVRFVVPTAGGCALIPGIDPRDAVTFLQQGTPAL